MKEFQWAADRLIDQSLHHQYPSKVTFQPRLGTLRPHLGKCEDLETVLSSHILMDNLMEAHPYFPWDSSLLE